MEQSEVVSRLEESEELNRAILETVIDAIITIDENGVILRFNPAAEKIFGYTREEAIGRKVNMLMPEPHRTNHDQYLHNYITTGIKKVIGIGREVQGRRKDGGVFPMYLAVSEMRVEGRRMFTGIIRDITAEKRLEKQRRDFYAMISHDIKSPLTVILGYTELLLARKKETLDNDVFTMISAMEKSGKRVLALLEDFLTASRLEYGIAIRPAPQSLKEIVTEICEQVMPLAKNKGLRFEFDETDEPPPPVNIDKKYFTRALVNIVLNAINYTPAGGAVRIMAGRSSNPGGGAYVSVSDTGVGIPEDAREKIFEKYYRAPGVPGKGTGLGLPIAKGVVEAHGGKIDITSTTGKGTTFTITLPASAVESAA